ncbi:MAG TPA: GNAT family N-acetyltransferase [Solirubrobacterales bacterium]|nr:GNAT family N-acetyltransferase [Solirubrobacterales bacterium]
MSSLPSDDRGWFELVLGNQPAVWRALADAVNGEVFTEADVQAAIVPASPNRSFFNSVFYEDSEHLADLLPRLAEIYEEAGVNAWTVWIPADDERARSALVDAGHSLDATPRAMAFELSALRLPEPDPELEIRLEMDMELLRQINETAYGYPPGDFPPMEPMPGTEAYLASLNGETVGTTLAFDCGEDTEITFVATLPEARGRGVAKRLLGHALERERGRGKLASTLIATKLGFPVYTALGYRDVGGFEMWERRKPE